MHEPDRHEWFGSIRIEANTRGEAYEWGYGELLVKAAAHGGTLDRYSQVMGASETPPAIFPPTQVEVDLDKGARKGCDRTRLFGALHCREHSIHLADTLDNEPAVGEN